MANVWCWCVCLLTLHILHVSAHDEKGGSSTPSQTLTSTQDEISSQYYTQGGSSTSSQTLTSTQDEISSHHYTQDERVTASHRDGTPDPGGALLLPILVSIAVIAICVAVIIGVVLCLRRRRRRAMENHEKVDATPTGLSNPIYAESPGSVIPPPSAPPPVYELAGEVNIAASEGQMENVHSDEGTTAKQTVSDNSSLDQPPDDPNELVLHDNSTYGQYDEDAIQTEVTSSETDDYSVPNKPKKDPDELVLHDNMTYSSYGNNKTLET